MIRIKFKDQWSDKVTLNQKFIIYLACFCCTYYISEQSRFKEILFVS